MQCAGVVLAVFLLRKGRYLAFALAVAAALLTREQLILTIPLLYLPLLVMRRWRTFVAALAIGYVSFGAGGRWRAVTRRAWVSAVASCRSPSVASSRTGSWSKAA
jgi:hypothetical protein